MGEPVKCKARIPHYSARDLGTEQEHCSMCAVDAAMPPTPDPVATILATECPSCLQQRGYYCSAIDENLCASRIRAALEPRK